MLLSFRIISVVFIIICLTTCQIKSEKNTNNIQKELTDYLHNAEDNKYTLKQRLEFALNADSIAILQKNDKRHLESLRLISNLYLDQDSLLLAKTYLFKTIELAKRISDQESLAIALNSLGAIFTAQSKYDSALEMYNSATSIFRKINNQTYLAQTLANIGVVQKNQGIFQESFKVTLDAIKIFESQKDTQDLAAAYTTLGNVLKELNRFDDALHYHQMALQLLRVEHDSTGMTLSLNNIGNIFRYKKDYKNALSNYLFALSINGEKSHTKTIATITDNIAKVYQELKDYNSAEAYFKKALDLRIISGDKGGFFTTSNRLSRLYLEENEIVKAEDVALKTINISPQAGFLKERFETNLILFEIYKRLGKNNIALDYASKSILLKDSLFNSDIAEKISQMKVKYESERKDIENASLRKDKIINATILAEQKTQKLVWVILTISISILAFLTFYFWRKRENYLFEQQISEVKQEALNAQMSDHFIGNTMDSINNFIRNNDKERASEYLILFSRLIRRVLENAQKKNVPVADDLDILKDYLELEKLRFTNNSLEYEIVVDHEIDMEFTLIPSMIFQVLAENAIKHGFNKSNGGRLIITLHKNNNTLQCSVDDNGIGRELAKLSKDDIDSKTKLSLGSHLAERLIKVSGIAKEKLVFKIIDKTDINNVSIGTKVEFILPYILME